MSTTWGPNPTGLPIDHLISNVVTGLVGTGSQQTIAHGLNQSNVFVIAMPHGNHVVYISQATDTTNAYITANSGDTYDLLFLAIK